MSNHPSPFSRIVIPSSRKETNMSNHFSPFAINEIPSTREEIDKMTPADRLLMAVFNPETEKAICLKEADTGWKKICDSGLLTDNERYAIFSALLDYYRDEFVENDETYEMTAVSDGTPVFDY